MKQTRTPVVGCPRGALWLAPVALVGCLCLTMAGCGAMGPFGKSPLLGNQSGSNAALAKVVKNDPFPTAAQAGLPNQSADKK